MTVAAFKGSNILIAEDESLIAEELSDRLERMGLVVTEIVARGEEAIAAAERLKPDIVLMDIRLRGNMDGIDAASTISERLNIPIVYLTAHSDDATLDRAKRTEPYGYLLKPFEERDLRIAIEMALYKHSKEKEIRESRELYATTLSSIGEGVISTDPTSRITYMNEEAERLTQWPVVEAHGQVLNQVLKLLDPRTRERLDEMIGCAMKEGQSHKTDDAILITREGREVPVGDVVTPLHDAARNIRGLVLVLRDLTEQKRAEEVLKKTEDTLQQAMRMEAIGRLAGGIAHDVNNMMTIVRCNSDLLLDKVDSASETWRRVDSMRHAAERAAQLSRQLLAFSRKQTLETMPINLSQLISSMRSMLASLLGDDIGLQAKLSSTLPSTLIDVAQMQQVIMNLAVNARDAMPTGGVLTLETSSRMIEGKAGLGDGLHVVLTVRDTGTGMSDHVKAHLFEPFFTTKEVGRGTGMGLATVFGIVAQFKGLIEVESAPGAGTTFQIFLPSCDLPATAEPHVPKSSAPAAPPIAATVLVVEDEPSLRELIAEFLRERGYRVLEAAHGEDALRVSENVTLQLLLTDAIMPVLGGKELAEQLGAKIPGLKVLFMSGYSEECLNDREMLRQGWSFIQKPFSKQDLLAAVDALVSP